MNGEFRSVSEAQSQSAISGEMVIVFSIIFFLIMIDRHLSQSVEHIPKKETKLVQHENTTCTISERDLVAE